MEQISHLAKQRRRRARTLRVESKLTQKQKHDRARRQRTEQRKKEKLQNKWNEVHRVRQLRLKQAAKMIAEHPGSRLSALVVFLDQSGTNELAHELRSQATRAKPQPAQPADS